MTAASRQTVLLTGAASGIGRATATALAVRGHDVLAYDLDADGLQSLAAETADAPGSVTTAVGDVRDVDRVAEVTSLAPFDALVNCAAFYELGAVEDVSGADLEAQFRTNVFGLHAVTRAALPTLRRRRGRVVTVSSVLGQFTMPYHGAYAATKHAVEALSDALRQELAGDGVDVVVVRPGPVDTGFNRRAAAALDKYADTPHAERYRSLREAFAAGGTDPERVADVVVEALEADDPDPHYSVTWQAWLVPKLRVALPTRTFDRLVTARAFSRGPLSMLWELLRGRR
jgi:short-subunit dehydrogenase